MSLSDAVISPPRPYAPPPCANQVRVNARRGSRTLTPSSVDVMANVARAGTTPGPISPNAGTTTSGGGGGGGAAEAAATTASGAKPDRGARDDADEDRMARRMPVAPWLTTTRSAPGGTASTAETEVKVGKNEGGDVVGSAKSKTATRGARESGGSSVGAKGFEPLAGAVGAAELARQRDPLWEYKKQVGRRRRRRVFGVRKGGGAADVCAIWGGNMCFRCV